MDRSVFVAVVNRILLTMAIEKIVQYDALDLARKALWIFGIYTGKKYPRRTAFEICRFLHFFISFSFMASMTVNIYLHIDDLEMIFIISHLLFTQIACTIKILYFISRLKDLNTLEELLEAPIFNQHTIEQERFITNEIYNAKILTNTFRLLSYASQISYSICPIIDGYVLAIPIWVPYSDGSSELIYQFYETVCFFILASIDPPIDVYPVELISIMVGQLGVLNDNIKHATERNEDDAPNIQEAKIKKRLGKCIEHHLAILSFLKQVQEIFSMGLFIQICVSVGAICMTGLQFLRISPKSASFYATLTYFTVISLEIGMCCSIGESIIEKSQQVRDACYMSAWYNCSVSIRKMLLIIMERSKRKSVVRSGNFFELSLATFVMIFRNAYSYFALLMQIYK